MVRIPNTLHIGEILISGALLEEARANPAVEVIGAPEPFAFEPDGAIAAF